MTAPADHAMVARSPCCGESSGQGGGQMLRNGAYVPGVSRAIGGALVALVALVALAGTAVPVGAQAGDLAPTGALRVAVSAQNTALAARDPATGEWRGPWIDLARA